MSGDTVVPFLDPAAKRANDELIERMKGAATNQNDGTDPNIGAIEQILQALEGMQAQVQALTDIVVEQDKRIEKLEKSKPGRIIAAR